MIIENMGILAGEKNGYNPFSSAYPRCLMKIPLTKYDPTDDDNKKRYESTILEHQLFRAKYAGIKNVFILSGKKDGKIIEDYIGDQYMGLKINFLYDEEKGTQPAIYSLLDTIDENILLMNGDVVSDANLKKIIESHVENQMGVLTVPFLSQFGVIKTEGKKIVGFEEKTQLPYNIDGGVYTISSSLKKYFEKPKMGNASELAFYEIRKKKLLNAFYVKPFIFWMGIESLRDYKIVSKNFCDRILKPWGYEIIETLTKDYLEKELFIMEDERTSEHYHESKRETIKVKDGRIIIKTDSEEKYLKTSEKFTLAPGLSHSIHASEDSLLEEISTPHPFDTIRVEDKYERSEHDKNFSTK